MTNMTTTASTTANELIPAKAKQQDTPVEKVVPANKSKAAGKTSQNTNTPSEKATPLKTTTSNAESKPITKATKPQKSPVKIKVDKSKTEEKVKSDNKVKLEKVKPEKVKMARDSFTMPKDEYAQLAVLKARMSGLGKPVKKSELLRAGIKLLTGLSDPNLQALMASVPVIKTGRPKKK